MEELIKINGLCAPNYEGSEMKWQSVKDCKPQDDQTILVLNVDMENDVPILAYYLAEYDQFFPLHMPIAFPLSITHWLAIPLLDKKCDKE